MCYKWTDVQIDTQTDLHVMTGWLAGTKGRYTYKTASQLSHETGGHGNKATIIYQRTE